MWHFFLCLSCQKKEKRRLPLNTLNLSVIRSRFVVAARAKASRALDEIAALSSGLTHGGVVGDTREALLKHLTKVNCCKKGVNLCCLSGCGTPKKQKRSV